MAVIIDESTLECSICASRFEDPRVLPCLHTFCRLCITQWLSKPGSRECPICRAPTRLTDIKKMPLIGPILDSAKTGVSCESCSRYEITLARCDHCSKSICRICQIDHTRELKQEITKQSATLDSEIGPRLEEQQLTVMQLISEATAAKEHLTRELREAHENLVLQIYGLSQKSKDILKNVEKSSRSQTEDLTEAAATLIAKVESVITSSAKIIEERNIGMLVQLDKDVTQLQADVDELQTKLTSSEIENMDLNRNNVSLSNIKINPAYKNIAALIAETDMLKKISA